MPETTLQTLSASLWDLRAQCEQKLRALTEAQRLVDQYRELPEARTRLKARLATSIDELLRTTRLSAEIAADCAGVVDELPVDASLPSTAAGGSTVSE